MAQDEQRRQEMAAADVRSLFWTPAELSSVYAEFQQWLRTAQGVVWGIPSMDEVILPMKPGDWVTIIGRPGHGKTTLLAWLARVEASRLAERGLTDKSCVVYVGLEPKAEEMEAMFNASDDLTITDLMRGRTKDEVVVMRSLQRASVPIWYIGRSAVHPRKLRMRLTVDNIYAALQSMQREYGVRPSLVLLDYLQILPVEKGRSRQEQVEEAVTRSKEVLDAIGAPLVAAAQAARRTDGRPEQMPTLEDAQHSSAIEQVSDKVFGFWRPYLTVSRDTKTLRLEGVELPINPRLLIGRCHKQRYAQSGQWFPLSLSPQAVRVETHELMRAAPQEPESPPSPPLEQEELI